MLNVSDKFGSRSLGLGLCMLRAVVWIDTKPSLAVICQYGRFRIDLRIRRFFIRTDPARVVSSDPCSGMW